MESSLSTVASIAAGVSSLTFSFIFVYMASLFVVALSLDGDDTRYESAVMANAALLGLGMAACMATLFSHIGEQIVATIMHMLQTSKHHTPNLATSKKLRTSLATHTFFFPQGNEAAHLCLDISGKEIQL